MATDRVTTKDVYNAIGDLRTEVRDIYVTKDDFNPVKKAVYSTAAMILVAFIATLITVVIPGVQKESGQVATEESAQTPSTTNVTVRPVLTQPSVVVRPSQEQPSEPEPEECNLDLLGVCL